MEDKIREFALGNAVKFKGKANQGAVVGKLMSLDASVKSKMKELAPVISKIVSDVNSMKFEDQKKALLDINPDYFDEQAAKKKKNKETRFDLPELKNAEMGKVITRISPEPSKYNHFGHAASFLINYMYALKYEGKCILRFEDTNPEKAAQEYVDAMKEDVIEFLDIKVSDTVTVSDHMDKYYTMAEKLISEEKAYTCTCEQKDISANRRSEKECSCRSKSKEDVKKDWEEMKKGTPEEGSITLRLKIGMDHKNAVMRDPVIFRLSYSLHYKQGDKYKVWPMYDFENAIEEGLQKVTHVLRSNEFASRIELQDYIRNLFDLPNPEVKQYARFNITGAITQGREIREGIEKGDFEGWDDPRLVTLRALKRRGFVKETFYELAKVVGMSKSTSNLDFSVLESINRKILNASAKRFFFIKDAIEVTIVNAPAKEIELEMHPDEDLGVRKFKVNEKYLLEKGDVDSFEPKEVIRLIDNLNFTHNEGHHSEDYSDFKGNGTKLVHFLPNDKEQLVSVEVKMPDNTILKGYAEKNIEVLKIGEVIQFQRFGFCRLDSINKNGTRQFWYSHN